MRRVALLRGINVGEAKRFATIDLRALADGHGRRDLAIQRAEGPTPYQPGAKPQEQDNQPIEG